jgi:hypothetical protein
MNEDLCHPWQFQAFVTHGNFYNCAAIQTDQFIINTITPEFYSMSLAETNQHPSYWQI